MFCFLNSCKLNIHNSRFAAGPGIMNHKPTSDDTSDAEQNPESTPRPHYVPSSSSSGTEQTPLLSSARIHSTASKVWPATKQLAKSSWKWIVESLNPPLIAAMVAVTFGLIPPLRHAFFDKGKPLNATIVQSIAYLGKLYTGKACFIFVRAPYVTYISTSLANLCSRQQTEIKAVR